MKREKIMTSWPFVEWTEILDEEDVKKLIVNEEVIIGEDVIGNMGAITKVELFSSLFKPHSLYIKGKNVLGLIAENKSGEYFYYALLENVHPNEKKTLQVRVEGESTVKTMREEGYSSNFAWNTRHIQRIVFPKSWKILSAVPRGYVIGTFRGQPSITWTRDRRYWGAVRVATISTSYE